MHEANNILDSLHGFGGDPLRTLRSVGQYRIDIDGVLLKFLHLRADRSEFRDGKIHQSRFESGELTSAELAEHFGFADPLQRR